MAADLNAPSATRAPSAGLPSGPGRTFILNFHGLGAPPDWVPSAERDYWLSPLVFTALLRTAIAETARAGTALAITFDDGNRSDLDVAAPGLQALGLTATFFVLAGRLDTRGYLSAADVRELDRAGMAIGSHGFDHVDWRKASDRELDRELIEARQVLEQALGKPIDAVGVPFGGYDRRVLRRLTSLGYRAIHTSDRGFAPRLGLLPRNTMTTGIAAPDLPSLFAAELAWGRRLRRRVAMVRKCYGPAKG